MWTNLRQLSLRRKVRQQTYQAACETLEERLALNAGGILADATPMESSLGLGLVPDHPTGFPPGIDVIVTATQVLTESETIPRFAAEPTITNTRGGDWSDPSIWSLGRVPTTADRVAIAADTVVDYATVSNARLDALEINGSLIFSTTVSTRLTVANLTVLPTGTLQIGTATNPVAPTVNAEIVIADKPIDLAIDPRQYGTGLIVLGKVTIYGSSINQTWSRLAAEPRAGDSSLLVAGNASRWRAGDTLVLPDTRQPVASDEDRYVDGDAPQWEEVVVDHIVGNRIYLTSSLQFNHLGARNSSGQLELMAHVADLNRNVVIRSENPNGTRGHTFYTARASVDIEFARFQDLGRTDAFQALDNTTFDASGNVTHLGTNQIGRYAVHFHHMMGPENPTNTGYQFKFVGNTIDRSLKWAVATHDTSFGLLENNVVYDAQGAAFVTEDGSEIGNLFRNNITIRVQGTRLDGKDGTQEGDYGRGGVGFWFRRAGNQVIGNVAVDNSYAGFVLDGYFNWDPVTLPKFRGADKHDAGEGYTTKLNPGGLFSNNETYGMAYYGLWVAYPLGDSLASEYSDLTIYNLRIWNVALAGVRGYHTNRVAFDQLLILFDKSAQNRDDTGAYGLELKTYENRYLVIRNSRIEGAYYGVYAPRNDASEAGVERPTIIQNTTLKNYINIVVSPPEDNRPSNGNALVVRDVKFVRLTNLTPNPALAAAIRPSTNIYMQLVMPNSDLTQRSVVKVYNYNQVAGDNFQVFYREQDANVAMPQTTSNLLFGRDVEGTIGSPAYGRTNQYNWTTYGIATAGGLLPAGTSASRPEINGLVGPIQNLSTITPRVVLVTPWEGAQVAGNDPVRVRFNVNGVLPAGATVYFSVDGGPPVTRYLDGGPFMLSLGPHVLRAFIGDAQRQQLPGTLQVIRNFRITAVAATSSGGGILTTSAPLTGEPLYASSAGISASWVGSSSITATSAGLMMEPEDE